ncbi:MAG: hypothetical protein ACREYE_08905 [Gammaproteobacteria bacterium]
MGEKITLDQYNLLVDLQGRVERVMTDLNRQRKGIHVEGLIVGNGIVPLTKFFELLASNKSLATEQFYNILWDEGQLAIKFVEDDETATTIGRIYQELRENFHVQMNEVFSLDKISRHAK